MAYKALAVPAEYDKLFLNLIVEMCITSSINNLD